MWRWRPPSLLCGSTSQIFSWASMITHLNNREFKHVGRFPRGYSSLASSDAAADARAQIGPTSSSADDDEHKSTAGASFSASSGVGLFEPVPRPHGRRVEILNDLRRELNLARRLFEDAEAQGMRHDAAAFAAAITRALCWSGMAKSMSSDKDSGFDVLAMFAFLPVDKNRRGPVDVVMHAFDAVIRGYAGLEMPDRAAQTFFQLCDRGYVPCVNTCNFLMNILVGCGDVKSVEEVYGQIKRSQAIRPNMYTFRILMEVLCGQGKMEEAADLLLEMKQEGVMPDSSIISELVCGLCAEGMTVCGHALLKCVRRWPGISMTTIDYNHVISGFCETEELGEAEEVLEDMVKQGVPPDVNTHGSLIRGYCSLGNISRVLSLVDQMDVRGIERNCAIQSSILHCFSALGMNAEVLELFEKLKKNSGQIVDQVLYDIAIDAQCKLGKMEDAFETFQEMRGCGLVPDKIHYTTLFNGYCRQGEIDNARKTFICMTDAGLKPDVETYNTLASEFAKSGFVEETLGLLYHMQDHGVEPNSGTYANVVEGFFLRGL